MKRLSKNILLLFVSEAGSRLIGFFTTIYLARNLSVDGFGIVNIGLTVFAYALLFGSQWLNIYGTRQIAAGEKINFIGRFVSLRFVVSFIVFILTIILTYLFIEDTIIVFVIVLFVFSIFPNIFFLDWYFQGKENLFPVSVGRLLISAVYLFSLLLFFSRSHNLTWVPASFLIGNTIGVAFVLYWFRKEGNTLVPSFSLKNSYSLFKKSLHLSSASVISQVNVNLPIIIIGLVLSATEAGIFSAASKLVFFFLLLDRFFYSLYFPAVTRVFQESSERLSEVVSFVLRIALIVIIPVTVGCILLSEPIIRLIFGNDYQDASLVFQILIGYFTATILNSIYGYGLVAIKQEKLYSKIIALSLIVYLFSTLIFTYLFGVIGTAAGVVVSEFVVLVCFRFAFGKFVQVNFFRYILKVFPALLVMIIVIYFTSHNLLLSIPAAALTYLMITVAAGGISKSDLQTLKEKIL
ncbi:MAG: oligosaccharide flippase family protein [Bacteroidetes bacterium]|nr:oligosaccharide flippase family protein [Bacteroidota bacterium]MBU1423884.1 oligosaccharide flippase family protein [Bacteroidota bacterium]